MQRTRLPNQTITGFLNMSLKGVRKLEGYMQRTPDEPLTREEWEKITELYRMLGLIRIKNEESLRLWDKRVRDGS